MCGYIHEGDAAPEKCPTCGVGSDKFVEKVESEFVWADEHKIVIG